MATLKDHQQAMVDLLASGSGIPASASRLAHAMHDVISLLTGCSGDDIEKYMRDIVRQTSDATTLGLNDKALAGDIEACRPKATLADRRVKELENTVKQLRANNAKLKAKEPDVMGEIHRWAVDRCLVGRGNYTDVQNVIIDAYIGREPEQAGCRKPDVGA